MNQTLIGTIRRLLAGGHYRDWVATLPDAIPAIQSTIHRTLQKTPQEIWQGSPNVWNQARALMQ